MAPSLSKSTCVLVLLSLASKVLGKTDLAGCTSTTTSAFGAPSILYYVPGTGEICSLLDCGGGRAPPKTTVPGCPLYSGTATVTPSYLPVNSVQSTTTAPLTNGQVSQETGQPSDSPSGTPNTAAGTLLTTTYMGFSMGPASSSLLLDTTVTLSMQSAAPTGLLFDTSAVTSPVPTGSVSLTTVTRGPTLTNATGTAITSAPSSRASAFANDAVMAYAHQTTAGIVAMFGIVMAVALA